MKFLWALLSVTTLIILQNKPANAVTTTLYDGLGLPQTDSPQWLIPGAIDADGNIINANTTAVSGGVRVDSNAVGFNGKGAEYSGYSNYNPLNSSFVNTNFPTLDRNSGYSIFFNVALDTANDFSDTNNNNRAAFSITTISTGNQGIEIGFDGERIFAQSSNFEQVAAETESLNTNFGTNYQLAVSGNTYQLLADTGSGFSPVINGSLRSYNFDPIASNPPLGTFNPYQVPNFIFLGDNTGQAHGTFTLGAISIESASVPFNFSPILGLALAGISIATRKFCRDIIR